MKQDLIDSFDVDEKHFFSSAISFQKGNKAFLINKNNGGTILLDKRLYKKIGKIKNEKNIFYKLKNNGFIIEKQLKKIEDNKVSFFIVELTNKCNLSCKYCFRNPEKITSIDNDTYVKVLTSIKNYVMEEKINKFSIQLWGGEPLLQKDKVLYARDFFNSSNLYPSITIQTNATLLSPQTVKQLRDKDIHLGVSIDGDLNSHNANRVYYGNKGSYSCISNSLDNLHAQGVNFGSISVVSKKTIKNVRNNIIHMCEDLGIYSLKLNLVQTENNEFNHSDIKRFIDTTIKTLKKLRRKGYPIIESNIKGKLQNLINRQNTSICNSDGCKGGRKLISFSTKGQVFPCDLIDYKKYAFGSINEGKTIKEIVKENIEKNSFFTVKENPQCAKCPFYAYCNGGCKTAKIFKGQEVDSIDIQECMINKYLYNKLIKLIMKNDYDYLL